MEDTSYLLQDLLASYEREGRPQEVSFRDLVPWLKVGERATHYIHPYPGKLLPHIAHFFLAAQSICKKGDFVLDPFGGTGTVALEALILGKSAYIADVNPLARLIANVKTRKIIIPDVVNLEHWYSVDTMRKLARLRFAVSAITNEGIRNFALVAFSITARKVSNADPRLSVPVFDKTCDTEDKKDVWNIFYKAFIDNTKRMEHYLTFPSHDGKMMFVGDDAKALRRPATSNNDDPKALPDNSVDIIVTSPPYAGAQKYIRASSLNIGWLGSHGVSGLRSLDEQCIGRENFRKSEYSILHLCGDPIADAVLRKIYKKDRVRAAIFGKYMQEMILTIQEMFRVLRPNGHIVFIIGNNIVHGKPFYSSKYLTRAFQRAGLTLRLELIDDIKSRGLMTKRNKTSSVITSEWVLLFQKGGIA